MTEESLIEQLRAAEQDERKAAVALTRAHEAIEPAQQRYDHARLRAVRARDRLARWRAEQVFPKRKQLHENHHASNKT